jgi:hypothetical protein
MGAGKARGAGRKPYGAWSEEIRDAFLVLLRETGNARAALRIVGHPNMFYKRRRRDPEFAAQWAEAVAAADARLSPAESAYPRARLRPAEDGGEMATVAGAAPLADADPGALLRPGTKRKQSRPEHVIRRTSNGRVQIALAREGDMTAEIEADFLARLRATGNFCGSARAVGFQPNSLFERMRKWPAFARDCAQALEEASVQLDYKLAAHAHALLRRPGETEEMGTVTDEMGTVTSDCPPIPFDPEAAMRILSFIDRRRAGRTTRGPRKGPPARTFAQAVASVLAKIEAVERHEEKTKAQGDSHS